MAQQIGDVAFLSYRGSMRQHIRPAGEWLHSSGRLSGVRFIKPDSDRLALDNELLMPFECFELMMTIWSVMEKCDTFVFLDSADYLNSVWTNMEIDGWRLLGAAATGFQITAHRRGGYACNAISFDAMSAAEKRLWAHLRKNLKPFALKSASRFDIPYRGSRLSTKHYLLPCRACGEYSLIAKKVIENESKVNGTVRCAQHDCRASYRISTEGKYNNVRYRTPIVAHPITGMRSARMRPLTVDELMQLYADKNPPPRISVGER